VNSYLLSSYVGGRVMGSGHEKGQREFQEKLISQLFELARAIAQKQKQVVLHVKRPTVAALEQHVQVHREREQDCHGCSLTGQLRGPTLKRKALGELSTNQNAPKRSRASVYGCKVCDVPLCKEGPCWKAYHDQFCE
jgi:hypothetical protein